MDSVRQFIKEHLPIVLGASIGVLMGILLLTIGFFPTLLLIILGGLGALLGAYPGIYRAIGAWLHNVFGKLKKD